MCQPRRVYHFTSLSQRLGLGEQVWGWGNPFGSSAYLASFEWLFGLIGRDPDWVP